MKTSIKYIAGLVLLVSFVSCQKNSRPNYQYMPNMYQSVGYETYSESTAFENGVESQLPAEGSIPRGYMPYDVPDTNEGYDYAKANVKSPLKASEVDYDKGGPLYTIYCGICHGNKGNGKGKLVEGEKILGVPSYDDVGRAITEGSVHHVIRYGRNTMGSYANQLNSEEQWQVVAFVMKLKGELEGTGETEAAATDASETEAPAEKAGTTETPAADAATTETPATEG